MVNYLLGIFMLPGMLFGVVIGESSPCLESISWWDKRAMGCISHLMLGLHTRESSSLSLVWNVMDMTGVASGSRQHVNIGTEGSSMRLPVGVGIVRWQLRCI